MIAFYSTVDALLRTATWEDGVEEPDAATLVVKARDDLPGVTPAMLAWFFAHLDRDLYLRFHPVDHEDFAWLRGKRPGTHVGATHLTHQRYGGAGPLMRAAITFGEPPPTLGDSDAVAICASVRFIDEQGREAEDDAAGFAHVAVPRPWGTELRSIWQLAWDGTGDRERATAGRLRHVHEEFAHLAGFLPSVYAEATA
jgi:hypothetical protein